VQAKLYAENYAQRRIETLNRSGGRCENILANGKRCPVRWGDWRITRSHQLQFEQLLIHHPNGDPENPDAEMIAVCWACHMRLHQQPGPGRKKASAQKQGYEVIRIPYLMDLLTRAGLHTWSTANGYIGWQIGTLASEANNHIEALTMALHWMVGEIHDLQNKLDQLQENSTMPVQTSRPIQQEREQDLTIHLQQDEQERQRQLDIEIRTCQASERRLVDAALREMRRRPLTGGVRYV
jgi:hypothetical protein